MYESGFMIIIQKLKNGDFILDLLKKVDKIKDDEE